MTVHVDRQDSSWRTHDRAFQRVLGPSPSLELLLTVDAYAFAHEAGVFFADHDELFITSNRIHDKQGNQSVQITKVSSLRSPAGPVREEIAAEGIHMGNGGVNYRDGILFCAQGSVTAPSGLFWMSREAPYKTEAVLTSYHGVPFNSLNDVVVARDGSIWFTDPSYGSEQGYRPPPSLPSQLYRYDPATESIRAMADGLGHPNGVCFSPDERTVYVTDTDKVHGSGNSRFNMPSSM